MISMSEVHDWQGESAVKQILVFPSLVAHKAFKRQFEQAVKEHGIENASDSGIGAMYKIRAVLNSDGMWVGVIRCGVTGVMLQHETAPAEKYQLALSEAYNLLQRSMLMPNPVTLINDL